MKKLTLLLVCGVFLSTTAFSNPNDNEDPNVASLVTIEPADNGRIKLNFKAESAGTVYVKILDKKGKTIHEKTVNHSKSFLLPFDMSNLEQGTYQFKITNKEFTINREVFVSQLHKEDVTALVYEMDNDIYRVKVFHEKVPVNLQIVDNYGRTYFNETYKMDTNFAQKFDLSKVSDQNLQLVIKGKKSAIRKTL